VNTGTELGIFPPGRYFLPNAPVSRGEAFGFAVMAKYRNPTPRDQTRKLVWSDEFDGNALNPEKWNVETGSGGWGNGELQYYSPGSNLSVRDGKLRIMARKEAGSGPQYTSGRINTLGKASWTYGKIEARIKLPRGQGLWPAFWMLGENMDSVGHPQCGEIDIVETVGGTSSEDGTDNGKILYGSLHYGNPKSPATGTKSESAAFGNPIGEDWGNEYHVYGIEWDESSVKHYVDRWRYGSVKLTGKAGTEAFHRPFFLLFNVAV
jgi:beta-glucanase (GH16 family)